MIFAGRAVALAAAERFARLHLELGGNAPVLICDDADLDTTAEQVAFAAFYNAGQDCTAASRVIAHEAVYDDVVQRLAEAARGTTVDPLISDGQRARVVTLLAGAPPHAEIVAGGAIPDRDGFYFSRPWWRGCARTTSWFNRRSSSSDHRAAVPQRRLGRRDGQRCRAGPAHQARRARALTLTGLVPIVG